ncbi:vanadium-dependent haloperoxidase [Niabella sp. CC-SYL272]|uniref:vanadium-dependent haloperoxidase n=1 Tax=Niabella agricola TaxID=2891571 RepID=UPI001F2246CE|nr:vanadium-dependent haloperoxidase [Niabella agricola]MCF3110834.1 vanadium-dependent haloperoxidase [Niabella agricola]
MKPITHQHVTLLLLAVLLFLSCQKQIQSPASSRETERIAAGRNNETNGHVKQTKTFTADVVKKWLRVQTALLYAPPSSYGINAGRYMAYCGVALYEAVQPGMPAYQSLYGQLNQMPEMPHTAPGKAYHWPTCANAALAEMTRQLFTFTPATGTLVKQLEDSLNEVYSNETGNAEIFERSKTFGKAVAAAIASWAATDHPWTLWPDFKLTNNGAGMWWPESNPPAPYTVPKGIAYWGETRTIVPGSIDNTISSPNAYNETPGSAYYNDMQEVYIVSKHLTYEQKLQAKYYDDPGKRYPAGAHYFSILKQVIEQLDPSLDKAAQAYAKAGISLIDGTIGSFKAKFMYATERPFQFIQRVIGQTDNAAKTWKSYIPTPAHPDFPSNHAVFSSSFAFALTSIFGDHIDFTNSTYASEKEMIDGNEVLLGSRHYHSFYDMAHDIAFSRLYGGIHTPRACEEGMKQGLKTAQHVDRIVKFMKE